MMDGLRAALVQAGLPGRIHGPGEAGAIPDAGGAYLLAIRLDRAVAVSLRRTAPVRLAPGTVVYCGSARGPGGLRARLGRHFRSDKARHWHVDQLTAEAGALAALPVPGGDECALVARLLDRPDFAVALAGFGSSDCRRCASHLLRYAG